MKHESEVKIIGYPQETVYAKIADLNNLAVVKERFNDPEVQAKMAGNIPPEKVEQVRKTLETLQVSTDAVSLEVDPVGRLAIQIVERDEPKCVKFGSVMSPVKFYLWVQLLPVTADTCKMRVTADADVPVFFAGMIGKPFKDGIEKVADMLASLPYE
ncbi:MAG: SRPBCC family protein [Bacteroidaceae bacterium]|nr:SRPBCC family protein [Bacteroidaceae bacterium]